jgi:DNA-binding CsgD family transcriptional regulator
MAIAKDFLWDTLETVVAELERADPQSVVGARVRGLLDARRMTDRHGPRRHYRTHDDECAKLYLEGKSTYRIAAEIGISVQTVNAALRRKGVRARTASIGRSVTTRKQDETRVDLIRTRRAERKTLQEIGAELHITRERVRQICVKNGINTEEQLTVEQQAAVDEYVSGKSLELVAATHNTSPITLRGWITRAGFSIRPSPKTAKRDPETLRRAEKAEQLYLSGKSVSEISRELGFGALGGPVYRLLAIRGIDPVKRNQEAA